MKGLFRLRTLYKNNCIISELTSLSNLADAMEPNQVSNEIIETAPDFENLGDSSGFNDEMSHDDMDIDKGPVQSLDDFLVDLPNEEENPSNNLVDLDQIESLPKSPSSSSSSSAPFETSEPTSSQKLPDNDDLSCDDFEQLQGDQNQNFCFQSATALKTRISDHMLIKHKCTPRIFLSFRFYVKSILENLVVLKLLFFILGPKTLDFGFGFCKLSKIKPSKGARI